MFFALWHDMDTRLKIGRQNCPARFVYPHFKSCDHTSGKIYRDGTFWTHGKLFKAKETLDKSKDGSPRDWSNDLKWV